MRVVIEDVDIRITLDDRLGHTILSASRLSEDGIPVAPIYTTTFRWEEFVAFTQLHTVCEGLVRGIKPQVK